MKAEIIAVGNEVVTGHTVNTNATYIASQIQTVGIVPAFHSAVCDEPEVIKYTVLNALERADYIFITGGLGPTEDDLTKQAVCDALGLTLELHDDVLKEIETYFNIKSTMPSINQKQAFFPKSAYILKNEHGTAPGCILKHKGKYIVLLPGPPKEMKPMLDRYALPVFRKKIKGYQETLDIKLFGIGESQLAMEIAHLLGVFKWGTVASYIGNNEVIVRICAWGSNAEDVKEQIKQTKKGVEDCLGSYIIGYNEDKLEERLVTYLLKNNYSVATVESCTGGMLASTWVGCSGVSGCFKEGIVTYSNEAKMKYVGVKEDTLRQFGAVSTQTAKEMAEGIRKASGATIGLSTTGIAGPNGGTIDKPVGLVYIGIALEEQTYVFELHLKGTRTTIREKTVKNILFQLYMLLK